MHAHTGKGIVYVEFGTIYSSTYQLGFLIPFLSADGWWGTTKSVKPLLK